MNKLLLLAAFGLTAFASQGAEALTDASFDGFTYDSSDNLWKSATVKLNETYFADNGWGAITSPDVNITNQTISLTTPAGMGYSQWQGQVKLQADVALSAASAYDFSCLVEGPSDAKVTVKLATLSPAEGEGTELAYWNQPSLTSAGKTCYFISNFNGIGCNGVMLVLDFGGYPNSSFTISDIVIRVHQDNVDVPADPTYAVPSTVPAPTQNSDDVLSLFCSKYSNIPGFVPASWGQATNLSTIPVDGENIYFLKSFTFQGWTIDPAIDITDYDYLHIDYWTANGENFVVTPINTNSKTGTTELGWSAGTNVLQSTWNSYDIPVSYWGGIDLTAVNQFKVDVQPANGVYGYIANIYFYKSDDSGSDTPSTGQGNGLSYTDKLTGNFNSGGTDYPYTINYTATWNENGTVTFKMTVDSTVPGLVVPEIWTQSNQQLGTFTSENGAYTFTTADTYKEGEQVFAFRFIYALNATLVNIDYKVGDSNSGDNPGTGDGDDDDEIVGTGASYEGTVSGTFTGAKLAGEDSPSDIPYTASYKATWNENGTVTIEMTVNPVVVGLVPQLNESNSFSNFTELGNGKYTITTTNKYENGTEPFKLLFAYAGGSANEDLPYTVGASGNDGTTAIEAIGGVQENGKAIYYNLQGVRVNNPVKGQIYIVNGKKVLVK